MISVRNHLPLLSGNKWLLFVGITLITAACSPKLQPVKAPVKTETEKPATKPDQAKNVKASPAKPVSIAMILPFDLDKLSPGAMYTDAGLKQANIALDYYQGFKLALDSLTTSGYNYKLQVFDSQGVPAQSHSLAYNPQIRSSDLIVGPIFPDDMKVFASEFNDTRKTIVSPLSPASPSLFATNNLVTVNPPLEYHAWAAARYINNRLKPQKVFILRSGYSEDNEYITPFKNTIDSLSNHQIQVIQLTVSRGNLSKLSAQLSPKNNNIFIIPSTNEAFLSVTLRSLDSLAKRCSVTLFGHPSWEKFGFLHADLLQRLKTNITSADKIDYHAAHTLTFMHSYRNAYHTDASDYAIKGFDDGLYFGRSLGAGHGELKNIEQTDAIGLHNGYHFIKKPGSGYINTHINILAYRNFELKQVE